jgi:hypothetical protein
MEHLPQSDMSFAGAAITLALFDRLIQKGILSRGDGLSVLEEAQKRCAKSSKGAAEIVDQLHAHLASDKHTRTSYVP